MAKPRRVLEIRPHMDLADKLLRASEQDGTWRIAPGRLPLAADIAALAEDFIAAFFPQASGVTADTRAQLAEVLGRLAGEIEGAVFLGLHRRCEQTGSSRQMDGCREKAKAAAARMMAALPEIHALLATDVQAALESDPAATGTDEIIACYPGLYAIAVYRAAHRLRKEGAEIVPRMLTEHSHGRTGIDIHPGATVGSAFFIDHGTGIVIGETTHIGSGVRIYQGVTLGALSVSRGNGKARSAAASRKRHPTIEDNVIIYANATILGGDTVIGRGAVVGGNAWITYSVPPGIRVGVGT